MEAVFTLPPPPSPSSQLIQPCGDGDQGGGGLDHTLLLAVPALASPQLSGNGRCRSHHWFPLTSPSQYCNCTEFFQSRPLPHPPSPPSPPLLCVPLPISVRGMFWGHSHEALEFPRVLYPPLSGESFRSFSPRNCLCLSTLHSPFSKHGKSAT